MNGKKRLIVLLLTFAMVLSQMSVVTFAVDNVAADNSDKAVTEQSADVTQPAAEPEEVAFDQSKTVSGVKVSVKADKGVFPVGSKLSVEKAKVPKAVDTKDAAEAYAFDISILAGGKKIQPDGNAEVSFTTDEVAEYNTEVFHMDGKKADKLEVDESGDTATVETTSFSDYVLVLYPTINDEEAKSITVSMDIGDEISLNEILGKMGVSTTYADDPTKSRLVTSFTGVSADTVLQLLVEHQEPTGSISMNYTCDQLSFKATTAGEGTKKLRLRINSTDTSTSPSSQTRIEFNYVIGEGCTVTFDPDGGKWEDETSTPKEVPAAIGSKIEEPETPVYEGKTFLGWFYTDAASQEREWDFDEYTVSEAVTLTAHWSHEHHWVVNKTDDGLAVSCDVPNCPYTEPFIVNMTANPATDKYTGTGYAYNGITVTGSDGLPEEAASAVSFVGPKYRKQKASGGYTNWKDYDESKPVDAGTYQFILQGYYDDGDVHENLTRTVVINPAKITITAPEVLSDGLVYNGEDQPLLKTDGDFTPEEGVTVPHGAAFEYYVEETDDPDDPDPAEPEEDDWFAESDGVVGHDAGFYRVWYRAIGFNDNYELDGDPEEGWDIVEIDKADPLKAEPKGRTLPYTGDNQVLVEEGELTDLAASDNLEILYSKAKRDGYGKNLPSEKDTGNYTFYWKIDRNGNDNYVDWYDEGIELTAKIYDGYVTPPVPSDGLVYNGEEQSLLAEGAVISDDIYEMYPGAEIYVVYGISESDKEEPSPYTNKTYSKVMGTDAGPYYVWYKAIVKQDGKTVYRSEPDYVVANIDKAVAEVTKEPVGRNVVYSGGGYRLVETAAVVDGGTAMYSGDPEMDLDDYSNSIFNKDEKYGLYGRDADDYTVYYYVKGDKNHYDSDLYQVTATISPVEAVLEWGEKSFEYDKEEHVPTATVKNLKTNTGTDKKDECTVTVEGAQVNVGKNYTATATELSNPNYTLPEDATTTFEITAKEVEILYIRAENKVYDGSAEAKLVYDSVIFDGRELGDELEIEGFALFDNKNVGTGKPVTALLHLVGPSANNYKLKGSIVEDEWGRHIKIDYDLKASITPLEATVKWYKNADDTTEAPAGAIDYVYNGKEQAPAAKIANAIESDGVEVVVGGEQKNAGKKYTAEVIELSGEDKDNYKLGSTAKKKFNILPKEVVLADWEDAESLVYDGTDKSPSVVVAGPAEGEGTDSDGLIIKGDDPDIVIFEVRNSENKVVTPIDADDYIANATGLIDDNYVLREDDPSLQHIFTVDEREAELVWSNTSPVYNGNEQQPVATVGNLVTREDTGKVDECDVTVEGAKVNAGNYEAEATALSNKNYKLPDDPTTKFSILPRQIQVVWSNLGFVYDGKAHKPTATITNTVKNDSVSATVTGEKTNAGTYKATVSSLTGPAAANYTVPLPKPTAQFTIGTATAVVTANDNTIYLNDEPANAGYTVKGLVGTDSLGNVTYTYTYKRYGKPGNYEIEPAVTNANPNYTIKTNPGTLTVKDKVTALVAKVKASGNKGNVSWNSVTNAKYYEVYFAKCNNKGKEYTCKKVATVKGTSYKKKGLKKGVCYKLYVVAKDANGNQISKSIVAHFVAGNDNGTETNTKSLSVKKTKITLAEGDTSKISASQKKVKSNRKLIADGHAVSYRYRSSNKKVATVSDNGTIEAVGQGFCRVYVQTKNGMWKTIEVTVK